MRTFSNTFLFLFALLNAIPVIGGALEYWPLGNVIYFYWAECALLAALAIFIYARRLIVFFLILLLAALMFHLTNDAPVINFKIALTFWGLYSLCWITYIEMGYSSFGLLLKRLRRGNQVFIYLTFMALSILLCFSITATIYNVWDVAKIIPRPLYGGFLAMAVGVPTLSISILKIIDMIGPRHFLMFLLGTYHRPVELDRVVVFLDMVGSSAMAEKMHPKISMSLIARFIFDATATFRLHGGDTINYTGDGLVALWPRKQADRALSAVIALRQRIEQNRAIYEHEFGVVPDFRAGLHAGRIVISQIGEEKLFLGVYGDTINTAARLESLNKDLSTKILMSDVFVNTLPPARRALTHSLGLQALRGRDEGIEVFAPGKSATP